MQPINHAVGPDVLRVAKDVHGNSDVTINRRAHPHYHGAAHAGFLYVVSVQSVSTCRILK